jgi:hypothetical protein
MPAAASAPTAAAHSCRDDHLARTQVTAARANVRTDARSFLHHDPVVILDNILDGDDGIGSFRNDAAGRDAHCFTRAKRARSRAAGRDPLDDGKAPRQIFRTHRETVHRGTFERRQVDDRARVLPEHTAGRLADRHRLRREPSHPLQHTLLSLRHGE